jgi:hypothetical protein
MTDDVLGIDGGEEWTPPEPKSKAAQVLDAPATVDVSKLPETKAEDVAAILFLLSGGVDLAIGKRVGASLTFTPDETADLARPIAGIINRRPALRALAAQGDLMDAVQIAIGSVKYGVRITGEAFETARQRKAELLEGASAEGVEQ